MLFWDGGRFNDGVWITPNPLKGAFIFFNAGALPLHPTQTHGDGMNKQTLIQKITDTTNISKKDIEAVLDATLDTIAMALGSGNAVRLVGFGEFSIRTRKQRVGRHPRTGAPIDVPETRTVAFVEGQRLRAAVKGK